MVARIGTPQYNAAMGLGRQCDVAASSEPARFDRMRAVALAQARLRPIDVASAGLRALDNGWPPPGT